MRIKVPESVVKQIARLADGRRHDDVEIAVDGDVLAICLTRTGELIEWSRSAYEAHPRKVKRSLV